MNTFRQQYFFPFLIATMLTFFAGNQLFIPNAVAGVVTVCKQYDTVTISPNTHKYIFQNNIWNDVDDSQCAKVDDQKGTFSIISSSHDKATNAAPAAYTSIFTGCHWDNCTLNSGLPKRVEALSKAISSWSITLPGSGEYNAAYDLWFNKTATTTGQPDGAELMIWLAHTDGIQPQGSNIANNISIAGATWNIWTGQNTNEGVTWNTITYVRTTSTNSVKKLDLAAFIKEATSRNSIDKGWYLISVEAGFEIWKEGAGLKSKGFSVTLK